MRANHANHLYCAQGNLSANLKLSTSSDGGKAKIKSRVGDLISVSCRLLVKIRGEARRGWSCAVCNW